MNELFCALLWHFQVHVFVESDNAWITEKWSKNTEWYCVPLRNISWFFLVFDFHRLTNKKSHKSIKCWCLKIYLKSAWWSHNENTTKEQGHKWWPWATIYSYQTTNVFGERLTWNVSMIRNCANGRTFDTAVCTQLLEHCFSTIYVGSGHVKNEIRNCDAIFTKILNRSISCFAKRYHSVSFYPARTADNS